MSTIYADSNPVQSLVEKKKRQWAREREELAGLSERLPWSNRDPPQQCDKQSMRSRYVTKYQKENDYLRRDSDTTPPRRQSLPPLYKNQNFTYTSNEKLDKEMGGETSGYGSDNPNQTPEHFPQNNWNGSQHHLGYESSSSGREDRLKWGDRGVHVGKFWEPKEVDNFGKSNDTPGWVKRGLERDTELVVSNTSPAESPEQDFGERPCTSSTISNNNRSYIRGQNVPVEPTELAERERRRQMALLHQEAIREQLEEREKKRREDKERKIREEYEEEMRIAREQELERQRKEREQRAKDEKQERERKRKEALREAIEIAEKQAREEKRKQRMMRQNMNMTENVVEVEKVAKMPSMREISDEESEESNNYSQTNEVDVNENSVTEKCESNKNNNARSNVVVPNNKQENDSNNNNFNNNQNNNNITNQNLNNFMTQENLALMLQNPLESFQNAQFAVLIPTLNNSNANSIPIAVPLPLYTDRSTVSTARTENRILTPTQYRNKRSVCDSSTQTDFSDFKQLDNREKYVREKLANLEIGYESRSRKERRSRSELRETFEDRPKWGVNRPPTRYLKQSEKDPLYQRRKLRQKLRQVKVYGDKCGNYSPHSSDDSQTGSPRSYRKRGYSEKRHSRALWRKNEQLFSENVRIYQTEIVPLEADKDHIYFKTKHTHQCCCKCIREKEKYCDQVKVVDILKIDHSTPRECTQYKCETEEHDKLPAFNNSSIEDENVLEKLNSIHHGLLLKQEHWDDTPRHSLHYSPGRNPTMDDFLSKKRDSGTILDLSKATANTKEEFRKLFDKVPDFKMKPEKVRADDLKITDKLKRLKFKTGKKDFKAMRETFLYPDPIPQEMRGLKVAELASVSIDWKMLTGIRPKNKIDEEYYSRIIELRKLEQKTEVKDKRALAVDPQVRKIKNRAGVIEFRVLNCPECWEDFCTGKTCKQNTYDDFTRVTEAPAQTVKKPISLELIEGKKKKKPKKKDRKSRSPTKQKRKGKKSKSPKKSTK